MEISGTKHGSQDTDCVIQLQPVFPLKISAAEWSPPFQSVLASSQHSVMTALRHYKLPVQLSTTLLSLVEITGYSASDVAGDGDFLLLCSAFINSVSLLFPHRSHPNLRSGLSYQDPRRREDPWPCRNCRVHGYVLKGDSKILVFTKELGLVPLGEKLNPWITTGIQSNCLGQRYSKWRLRLPWVVTALGQGGHERVGFTI